ncbi:MAG TPA: hypothetical protein VI547_12550 [Anaerolineales bacterium]|nr:hypothetical protein [Anaerolineales bacterium]
MTCDTFQRCAEIVLQLLVFGISNGAGLALNAIGVTVVYGTVRTLNLAHGDVFALSSVLVVTLIRALNVTANFPPVQLAGALMVVLAAAMLFGALLNVSIERVAFRPFRNRSRLAPLIALWVFLSFCIRPHCSGAFSCQVGCRATTAVCPVAGSSTGRSYP